MAEITAVDRRRWLIGLALLALACVALRARYFGNPFIDVDEEFYLLAGDRLLHGALPYVDIWDRKPVGIFLLYAATRLFGGDGVLAYQVLATLFAGATAMMIAVIARMVAPPRAALLAAFAYIPALAMNGGAGGQTPVFYNLPVALAAWLIARLAAGTPAARTVRLHGLAAMLLVGLALQVKYSALFEGVYFGLALIWLSWRAAPGRPGLAGDVALWIAAALLPTALAYAVFAAMGAGPAFLYANFGSIGQRGANPWAHQMHDLAKILVRLSPFAPAVLASLLLRRRVRPQSLAYAFLGGWLVAALIGFAAFGTFFNHYALPLLVPLCILAAPAFAIRYRYVGTALATLVLAALLIAYPLDARKLARKRGDAAYAATLAAEIAPRLHGRCLYIFYGEPILYQLTHSCLPTRWPFPFHLAFTREAGAIGVDVAAEVRRIVATRPPVVVDRQVADPDINPAVASIVRTALARDYRLAFSRRFPRGDVDQVWVLKKP